MKKKAQKYSIIILTIAILSLSSSVNAQIFATGENYSLAVCPDGTVYSWGREYYGQLGYSTNGYEHPIPHQVTGLSNMTAVAAGAGHSFALKNDGTVWTWGRNETTFLTTNVIGGYWNVGQAIGLNGITAIASGDVHSLALKNDGTVWTAGINTWGQLGNGNTTNNNTAGQVTGLSGIIQIAAGTLYSLALKSDGTVWTWGYNAFGQLGNGTTTQSNIPVKVLGLQGVIAISAGKVHSLALKNDGTVWSWGQKFYSSIGTPTNIYSNVPEEVPFHQNIISIAGINGDSGPSFALKSDGTVWEWNWNLQGQVENYTQVAGLQGISIISEAKYSHFLALKNDGELLGWGFNTSGQVGNGILGNGAGVNLPVQIPAPVINLCSIYNSIEERLIASLISVYPNPSNNSLMIEGDFQSHIHITLTDVFGKQVLKQTENGLAKKYELNTEGLSNGIYLLKIQNETQQIMRKVNVIH